MKQQIILHDNTWYNPKKYQHLLTPISARNE
jgi:hypothetical protein